MNAETAATISNLRYKNRKLKSYLKKVMKIAEEAFNRVDGYYGYEDLDERLTIIKKELKNEK